MKTEIPLKLGIFKRIVVAGVLLLLILCKLIIALYLVIVSPFVLLLSFFMPTSQFLEIVDTIKNALIDNRED